MLSDDTLAAIVLIGFLILFAGVFILYQYWLSRSQPSDIPRIKARLEANQHRVVDIRRDGFVVGGRSSPSYRKYRVVVRSPLGGPDEVHVMGVQATIFSYPALQEFGGPPRHRDFS